MIIKLNILKSQTRKSIFDFENIDSSNTTKEKVDSIIEEILLDNKNWLSEISSNISLKKDEIGVYSVYNLEGNVDYNFEFSINDNVIFCKNCKRAWPATNNKDDYKDYVCLNCGSDNIYYGSRLFRLY